MRTLDGHGATTIRATGERLRWSMVRKWGRPYYSFDGFKTQGASKADAYREYVKARLSLS